MPEIEPTELDPAEVWSTDSEGLEDGRGANPELAERVRFLQEAQMALRRLSPEDRPGDDN